MAEFWSQILLKAWLPRAERVFPDPETRWEAAEIGSQMEMTQAALCFRSRRHDSERFCFLFCPVNLRAAPRHNQRLPPNFVFHAPPSPRLPSIPSVSHLSSQPALITSPPPRGSYFLIAGPSCSGIPEINSPPLCYSYYLGVLELACPSKRTLYSCASFPTLLLSSASPLLPHDLISGHILQTGTGDVEVSSRQKVSMME